jgi:RNA polymerase sigma-70 factor (ECF subfamily)
MLGRVGTFTFMEATPSFTGWVTRLVHQHRASLARVARREGLRAEEALDVVQEAFTGFLGLPHARALVDSSEDARKLLVTLTRNLARNRRRLHHAARPHLSDAAVVDGLPDQAPGVEERVAVAEEQARLAGCVGCLAAIQRRVVRLRLLEEVPGADVARLLGIAPGHVAVLLHRAKANLLTCMTAEEQDNQDNERNQDKETP